MKIIIEADQMVNTPEELMSNIIDDLKNLTPDMLKLGKIEISGGHPRDYELIIKIL